MQTMEDRRAELAARFDEDGDATEAAAVRECMARNPDGCDTCAGLAGLVLDDD